MDWPTVFTSLSVSLAVTILTGLFIQPRAEVRKDRILDTRVTLIQRSRDLQTLAFPLKANQFDQ